VREVGEEDSNGGYKKGHLNNGEAWWREFVKRSTM